MARRGRITAVLLAALTLTGCSGGLAPRGAEADQIFNVTVVLTVATVAVLVIVFGAWIWAVVHPGTADVPPRPDDDNEGDDRADPVPSPDHLGEGQVERRFVIGGGVIMPGLVMAALFGLGVWTMTLQPQQGDVVIKVTGHQYWWEVSYPQGPAVPVSFETANEIAIPTDTDVQMVLSSDDVIHSFWVPQLAGKVDLVPGQTTGFTFSASTPGDYNGYCAEYCGLQHAWMRFQVKAMPPDQFAAWVQHQSADARQPTTEAQTAGQQVFTSQSCAACHAIRGVDGTGDFGPDLTHLAARDSIGAGVLDLTPANLADWILDPQASKRGNLMPPQQLSGQQLDDLVAYLTSLQ